MLAAILVNAPTHTLAPVAWHEHWRVRLAVVPLVFPQTTPDLERIAEALGGQQAHLGPFAFDHAVRRHRRAVHQERTLAEYVTHATAKATGYSLKRSDDPPARI